MNYRSRVGLESCLVAQLSVCSCVVVVRDYFSEQRFEARVHACHASPRERIRRLLQVGEGVRRPRQRVSWVTASRGCQMTPSYYLQIHDFKFQISNFKLRLNVVDLILNSTVKPSCSVEPTLPRAPFAYHFHTTRARLQCCRQPTAPCA